MGEAPPGRHMQSGVACMPGVQGDGPDSPVNGLLRNLRGLRGQDCQVGQLFAHTGFVHASFAIEPAAGLITMQKVTDIPW